MKVNNLMNWQVMLHIPNFLSLLNEMYTDININTTESLYSYDFFISFFFTISLLPNYHAAQLFQAQLQNSCPTVIVDSDSCCRSLSTLR